MNNFFENLKSDSKKAGLRIAANQATRLTKTALLAILEKNFDQEQVKIFSKLLETEYGTALVGFALGCTLRYAPKISEHKNAQILGEEFVVSSLQVAGNEVIEQLLDLVPNLVSILDSIPEAPQLEDKKIRIKDLSEDLSVDETETQNLKNNVR